MLVREDFLIILKNTIENYFQSVYNKDIEFSYENFDNSDCVVINKQLSFVTKTKAPASLWRHLNSEYNVRGNWIKYLVAKAAIVAVCFDTSIGKLRHAYITKGCLANNIIISPQNRSIRFYDYDHDTVDSIIKSGFTNKYFKAQLDFRINHNYSFLNPLLSYGDNWFREPILVGHPLVRETNQKRYEKGYCSVIQYINQIINDTIKYVNGTEYIKELYDCFIKKLKLAKANKHIKTYNSSMQLINQLMIILDKCDCFLPVCLSHGDLQSGNVWVNTDGSCLIYDWETVGQRSVWYDRATFEYELRRPWGWDNFLQADDISKINIDRIKVNPSIDCNIIKALVLLEDLHFYIDDMLELPYDWGSQCYDEFVNSINRCLK